MLNKTVENVKRWAEENVMNYELTFPIETFKGMAIAEAEFDATNSSIQCETLEGLSKDGFHQLKADQLLHFNESSTIQNQVVMLSFEGKPTLLYQLKNGGIQGEVILEETAFRTLLNTYSTHTNDKVDELIRWYGNKEFTVSSASDHILIYENGALISTTIHDFPEMDE